MKILTSALALATLGLSPVTAEIAPQAREVHEAKQSSILGIRGIVKMTASMNGNPAGSSETEIWNNALVIGDGLAITAYRAISPDLAAQQAQRPGLQLSSETSELNLVDASGEEYPAKLILHDDDLGVAFLAIDPSSEAAANFKVTPIDISGDPEIQLLQELVSIGRYNSNMRFTTSLRTAPVSAVVERPRLKYAISGMSLGQTAFTADGEFVGLVVPHTEKGKTRGVPVILPSKYIRNLVDQAKEKQAELKK